MHSTWTWPGSRWWKFDFHNHTPASADYGKGNATDKEICPKDWLLNYMRAGIECVAITDHNSGDWIDKLKNALTELEESADPDYQPLCLFPGVEISVSGGIHILAIFDMDKTTSDIARLLGAVRYHGERGETAVNTELAAGDVINTIVKHGGLAIPAHVDKRAGLFEETGGHDLKAIIDNKNVIAIELVDSSYPKPQLYLASKRGWSEVLGSDSHYPPSQDADSSHRFPGSSYTWVKMTEPSLEGLRLALLEGKHSLKRSDCYKENPNKPVDSLIEGIKVKDARHLGKGETFSLRLNPWLNTIIGGRGTGKSTMLEFLRLALEREDEIPESLEQEFAKYTLQSGQSDAESLIKEDTAITVYFWRLGKHFRIIYQPNNKSQIFEKSKSGAWEAIQGDVSDRFPVRIFGQKQIFELAKNPNALLGVIDDSEQIKKVDWKSENDDLVNSYLALRAEERKIAGELDNETKLKGKLDDVKNKLMTFENSGAGEILSAFQKSESQCKAIINWEKEFFESNISKSKEILSTMLLPALDPQQFDQTTTEDKSLFDEINRMHHEMSMVQKELKEAVLKIEELNSEWKTRKGSLEITRKIEKNREKHAELIKQRDESSIHDVSNYSTHVEQKLELEKRIQGFAGKRLELNKLKGSTQEVLQKIITHREELTDQRMKFIKTTSEKNEYIGIQVIPLGGINSIEHEFRELINTPSSFERAIGAPGKEGGLFSNFTKGIEYRPREFKTVLQDLKDKITRIHQGDEGAARDIVDGRFVTRIENLSPEQIDKIQAWLPKDSLNLKIRRGDKYIPLEQGSPGQRTSALLAFFLSYGSEPLILDQPEDDLDNQWIYELIVKQLREIKQNRQVLVVTHNANIVVNGDAENIISLDVESDQTIISAQGGLQEESIKKKICDVMEGGKEAFEKRYKRINAT